MNEVKEYLKNKIEANSSVVIACSGGPDSMCLLNLLIELKQTKELNVICAHVNHKMRIESEEEAEFVKDYCMKNDVVFEYMEITDYNEDNFHNQARIKRYEFFKTLLKKYDAKYLLTAHHSDDLMETILMRIVRGSNLKGYIGFKRQSPFYNYQLLRPLITKTKTEIENYNQTNNIPYVIDKSNEKDKYTRNRYRHNILPFLKNEDEQVHKKFLKFSEELIKYDEFLTNYMSNILTKIIRNDTIDIPSFQKLDPFIKRKVIESMVNKIQENNLLFIEDKHIDLILDMLNSSKSNVSIELPNGFIAQKSYNEFNIVKSKYNSKFCIKLDNEVKLENGYKLFLVESSDDTSNNTIRLNSKDIKLPLYVRNKREGDKMIVKNLGGTKKIKDIFIDEKITIDKRESWPIVVDSNNEVIWIPGLKKSKFDKKNNEFYDIIIRYEEENDEQ